MELLPNYKCLTKIKNHLQLGLIRELIGLLPVGKQWGQARAIGSVRTKKFAITFPSECNIAMALPWKDDGLAYQINIQSVELSSFKYYYYTAVTEVEICYIAFGV